MLRGSLSQDWPSLINKVSKDYNNTPLKKIGWLKPNDITNISDSVKVNENKKKHNISIYREPNFKAQSENVKAYELKNNLKTGDYVYLDFGEDIFGKSFDVQERYKVFSFNTSMLAQNVFSFFKSTPVSFTITALNSNVGLFASKTDLDCLSFLAFF